MQILDRIELKLNETHSTFCDFAYDLNGVLKD